MQTGETGPGNKKTELAHSNKQSYELATKLSVSVSIHVCIMRSIKKMFYFVLDN